MGRDMGMGADYYNTLKVNRNATDDDLRKSYKRLAMIWHPDRNPTAEAEPKFKQISEAYEVLSHPQKRRIYDLYGEEALKSGEVPSPPPPSSSSAGSGAGRTLPPRKAPAVECPLPCSLEELYKGVRRKMKISRDVITDALSGKVRTVEEVLTIDIKPGWKKGTKITFPEKGNQGLGIIPSDLVFVVDEKPHAVYKRDGNDLVFSPEITLLEALTGKTFDLTTLDGRTLTIQVTEIVRPGYEVVIPHEGMPISKEPSTKGRLRIKFDVKYPARITTEQKAELIRTLGGIS